MLDLQAMAEIEIRPFSPSKQVTEMAFRSLLKRSRIVPLLSPLKDGYSYSPWFSGSFRIEGKEYSFSFFLGGRCKITLPSGDVLVVEHVAPDGSTVWLSEFLAEELEPVPSETS